MSNGAGNNAKTFPLGQDSAGVITFEHVSVIASTLWYPALIVTPSSGGK